jgi:hypothetical protein
VTIDHGGVEVEVPDEDLLHSEPLSNAEKLTFDALEAAYDLQTFSIWFRTVELGILPPESIVLDTALVYNEFPGLLAAREVCCSWISTLRTQSCMGIRPMSTA